MTDGDEDNGSVAFNNSLADSSIVNDSESSGSVSGSQPGSGDSNSEGRKNEGGGRSEVNVTAGQRKISAGFSSDARSSSTSGDADDWQDRPSSPDLPPEYWQVQRLIKYIKAGNPTATIISLSTLKDFNLNEKFVQMAIRDAGGLEVLLNILETDESRCKRASLAIIRIIATNPDINRTIYNMQGLDTLVNCLEDPCREVKILSAETVANICTIGKARRAMRSNNGIQRLVEMLNYDASSPSYDPTDVYGPREVARTGALALWSVAKSTKNREEIRKAGAIPFLAKLMKTKAVDVIIPTVGILQECASEPAFRSAIYSAGLLKNFVEGLQSTNLELVQFCAMAICMCTEDKEARQVIYDLKGIDPFVQIIQNSDLKQNKVLLGAATGTIAKCAGTIFKTKKYVERGLIESLISMLDDETDEILINISASIEQIIKIDVGYAAIVKKCSGIPMLTKALTIENEELLVNVTKAIGALAEDLESREEMERLDGFRLIWSLLKHTSVWVQASAAWAICPYVKSSKASSEMVRNYVGGLEALVTLLTSEVVEVQAAVCEAVAAIASNSENLAIMSDQNVVQYLTRIALTQKQVQGHEVLKRCLAKAIAGCSKWGQNSREFGERQSVRPICLFLNSKDSAVIREAAKALCALSKDPRNCITIHQCGVVRRLIRHTGSRDEELREAAASVMANIRTLALTTERIRFYQMRK